MAAIADVVERPHERIDPITWLRKNLFSTWYNGLLTLLALTLIFVLLRALLTWVFFRAEWSVVAANLRLFMVGTFPVGQSWRIWLCVALAAVLLGLSWGIWPSVVREVAVAYGSGLLFLALVPFSLSSRLALVICSGLVFGGLVLGRRAVAAGGFRIGRWVVGGWILLLPMVILLLRGFGLALPAIPTNQWGGLLLTMLLAIFSIVLSFPLGVLLAIGRRSSLPAFSLFCTAYIELIRGVPLITVLFLAQNVLPLFVPGGESIDAVVRAIAGFTLFTAAYIAENVRGGLQAIPRGQEEAARALGLNPFLTMGMIILPQALRIVIPSNVGQFISLFKDTSLVVVAFSLLDMLGVARAVVAQNAFLGKHAETLAFAGLVY
ncbi:MAG TPA: amino acid ABC transporter permease, partial [Roseiflexaceae bacterium]|nr:amino acid ABC transporter permease [Roseiflexaceae bacterium]